MKALVTDQVHPILLEDLEAANIEYTYLPKINQKEVESLIKDFEIIIINSKIRIDNDFLRKAEKLKVIGRLGSGLEIIDLDAAKARKVKVFNSPKGNRDAVAEHAVGMILSLFNHMTKAHRDVIHFDWNREANRGEELMGKTIGIIGFGQTGQAFARKLIGFDVNLIYYDKYLKNSSNMNAQEVTLEYLQEHADVVSFHVPYTEETHYYFNEDFASKMKKDFYLINTSRGKVICQDDLLKFLNLSKVRGACLDVFENENVNSYSVKEKEQIAALNKTGKVLFSTHVAGWTRQSKYKLAKILSQKIITELS